MDASAQPELPELEQPPEQHWRLLGLMEGKDGQLGAAVFDDEENGVQVFARVESFGSTGADVLLAVLRMAKPTLVVVPSRSADAFVDRVRAAEGQRRQSAEVAIERLGSNMFGSESARRQLAELGFPDSSRACPWLSRDNALGLAALGGVLHKARKAGMISDDKLSKIELISLDDFLQVDMESLHSLDVVREEQHPSIVRSSSKSKDGFSLIMLLDNTKSVLGKRMLRKWVLQPLANVDMINARLDAVDYLKHPLAVSFHEKLHQSLSGLRDMVSLLSNVRKRTMTVQSWLWFGESINAVDETLALFADLIATLQAKQVEAPSLLIAMLDADRNCLGRVEELLGCIDWDETQENGWVVPKSGVSPPLDAARASYAQVDAILDQATRAVRERYTTEGSWVEHLEPTYVPIIGFLMCVESEKLGVEPVLPRDFEICFTRNDEDGDQLVYLRCSVTEELNDEHGDLYGAVRAVEEQILRDLQSEIVEVDQILLRMAQSCGDLDVLLSFTAASLASGYTRPSFQSSTTRFEAKQAIHPLLKHNVEQYVPNDISFGGGQEGDDVLLITGPNYSGKSALLKTVALLTIMAQIGCFVPAEFANLSVVDRLFTRVESLETSAAVLESSFSIDAQQVANLVRNATPKSLLIMDEFGKGTAAIDGASLLVATIKWLCGQGNSDVTATPKTLISTHLLEIFEGKLLDGCQNLRTCEMKVLVTDALMPKSEGEANESDAEENQESKQGAGTTGAQIPTSSAVPIPLFELCVGSQSSQSYALACAKRARVPFEVLRRASVVLRLVKHGLFPTNDSSCDAMTAEVLDDISRTDWSAAGAQEITETLERIRNDLTSCI